MHNRIGLVIKYLTYLIFQEMHTIYTTDLLSSYILGSNLSTKNLSDDIFEINMVKKKISEIRKHTKKVKIRKAVRLQDGCECMDCPPL